MSISERDVEREIAFRRASQDCYFWMTSFMHIRVPGQGRILLPERDCQRETLDVWQSERYTITLKARQLGFSTLVAGYALWLVLFHPDRAVAMFSKGEREAAKLLKKSAYAYRHQPQWLKERLPRLLTDNQLKMEFDNESLIESLPSGEDPGRSEAVDLAIVDEWAFLPNPEDAWAAIEPITDVGGGVIGISTANGTGNFFHEFYQKAKMGGSPFTSIFFPYDAHEDRDDAWYAAKSQGLQEWQLHQEYPRDDVECFVKSGNPVFDLDDFSALAPTDPTRGVLSLRGGDYTFAESSDGEFAVYERPDPQHSYVIGADVAEGLRHGDWSVAQVIDMQSNAVVCTYRAHVDPDVFGKEVLYLLGSWYNRALVGVESNNHGLTTCTALRDRGYQRMYYRQTYDERYSSVQKKMGWYTTAKSKPMIIDELRESLREGLRVPDRGTIQELRTYARDENGRMGGRPFDDAVMALAIANKMGEHAWGAPRQRREAPNPMSAEVIFGEAFRDASRARDGMLTDTSRSLVTR